MAYDLDIYSRKMQTSKGAMSADDAIFTASGGAGLITQSITLQYSQPVSRIYDIGSQGVYLVAGRPRGEGSIVAVVGPAILSNAFITAYGNVCSAVENSAIIAFGQGCRYGDEDTQAKSDANSNKYLGAAIKLFGIVLTSLSDSVRAEDMVITEQLGFMFLGMQRIARGTNTP